MTIPQDLGESFLPRGLAKNKGLNGSIAPSLLYKIAYATKMVLNLRICFRDYYVHKVESSHIIPFSVIFDHYSLMYLYMYVCAELIIVVFITVAIFDKKH